MGDREQQGFFRRTWIDYSVEVNAGKPELFGLLREIDGWPSFTPNLERILRWGRGPIRVGVRFVMVLKMPGSPTLLVPCQLYELSADRMEWGGGGMGSVIRHYIELEALDEGHTRLRQVEYATGLLALATLPFEKAAHRHDKGWSDAIREHFAAR